MRNILSMNFHGSGERNGAVASGSAKAWGVFFFAMLSAVCISGCGRSDRKDSLSATTQHRIIIDTDTAGDDALAIAMVAKAPNVTIEGLTVLAGNVDLEQGAANALMTLEMAGCSDIPVYKGADISLDGEKRELYSVFGKDGMGDNGLIHPAGKVAEGDAVEFILNTVRANPGEIEILAIGPATNIAMAIEREPETMKLVKRVWIMGTAGFGAGNATPVAEFNVYSDADACKVLLEAGIPVTVVGLDMCELDEVLYYEKDMAGLAKSCELGSFLVQSWDELLAYKKEYQGMNSVDICDAIAAAALIWDDFADKSVRCSSFVCTEDGPTYGQVIFYKEDYAYDSMPEVSGFNVTVIEGIQADKLKKEVSGLLSGR